MSNDDLVVVGRIGRPHGLAGEMYAFPTGATLVTLAAGDRVRAIGADAGPGRDFEISALRSVDRGVLLRLLGVETREAVQALTGATISVTHDRLALLDATDEFYVRDLVGCSVFAGEMKLGPVTEVYPGAANDALVVVREGGEHVLVPFTKDAVVELDLVGRRVVIRSDLLGDLV
jgi:16S rRNA processing protein RimM